jgi:4,5-DOPA dioxygenase extradiol
MSSNDKVAAGFFVSHGAPNLLETPAPARSYLSENFAGEIGRPRAIVVASAHFETMEPVVGTASVPETIHDFGGFSAFLHSFNYPAKGAPAIAEAIAEGLRAEGYLARINPAQGLDHGIWVPLALTLPQGGVPVIPVSIQPHRDARYHFAYGRALRRAVPADIPILATGSLTHNLRAFRGQAIDAPPAAWASEFAEWVAGRVAERDLDALLDFEARAPGAAQNHPTDEHFLPLFVALGAGVEADPEAWQGRRLHHSYTYSVLAMDAYRFGPAAQISSVN